MRIDRISFTPTRLEATVIWEAADRPPDTIYFEADRALVPDEAAAYDALLVGLAIPALRYGERRLSFDGPICPHLRENVSTALHYLRHWFYYDNACLPEIEAPSADPRHFSSLGRGAGLFFSGGIDSLSTLRRNHLNYQPGHPYWATVGILVYGFEIHDPAAFAIVQRHLLSAASAAEICLVSISTNLYAIFREEDQHLDFLIRQFEGAFFGAIAHLFGPTMNRFQIASTLDVEHLRPNGSHPLLNYSSCGLTLEIDGITLSRFTKARSLSRWEVARKYLRVCNRTDRYRVGHVNCGECNKCVCAMLMFTALGTLEHIETFAGFDLNEATVLQYLTPKQPYQKALCRELIPALRARGRSDLAGAVSRSLAAFEIAHHLSEISPQ